MLAGGWTESGGARSQPEPTDKEEEKDSDLFFKFNAEFQFRNQKLTEPNVNQLKTDGCSYETELQPERKHGSYLRVCPETCLPGVVFFSNGSKYEVNFPFDQTPENLLTHCPFVSGLMLHYCFT